MRGVREVWLIEGASFPRSSGPARAHIRLHPTARRTPAHHATQLSAVYFHILADKCCIYLYRAILYVVLYCDDDCACVSVLI